MVTKSSLDPLKLTLPEGDDRLSPVLRKIAKADLSGKQQDRRLRNAFDEVWLSFRESSEVNQGYINQMQRTDHFWKSWFEMYFWWYLDAKGYRPENRRQGGSDSEIKWRGRNVQFENVSPSVGRDEHPHKVTSLREISAWDIAQGLKTAGSYRFPNGSARTQAELDLIIRRITTSFSAKAKQLKKRLEKGTVSEREHCVIVIDVSQVRRVEHFDIDEVGMKALYGLGQEYFAWNGKGKFGHRDYEVRTEIAQLGRGSIPTNYLLGTREYSHIAAVILCDANISDFASGVQTRFYVFHNFHARNSLTKKLFREHRQYCPVQLGRDIRVLAWPERVLVNSI